MLLPAGVASGGRMQTASGWMVGLVFGTLSLCAALARGAADSSGKHQRLPQHL